MSKEIEVSEVKTQCLELVPSDIKEEHLGLVEGIKTAFQPMVETFQELDGLYEAIILESKNGITRELGAKAKRLRLDHRAIRVAADKVKTAKKAMILVEGRFIDTANKTFKEASIIKESKLEDIEKHYDRIEAELIAKVQQEREDELFKYAPDEDCRNLTGMEEDVWLAFIAAKKSDYEKRIAEEKKAEEARLAKEKAEAEEKKRLKEENERLKAEAEAKAKAEAEAKIIQDEKDRIAKEEAEAKQAEIDRLAKIEADKLAKVKAELKAKEEAEAKRLKAEAEAKAKAEAEAEAAKQAELKKGDSEKFQSLVYDLGNLKGKYTFDSVESKKLSNQVDDLLTKIINHINK